jgi:hypothetical protein
MTHSLRFRRRLADVSPQPRKRNGESPTSCDELTDGFTAEANGCGAEDTSPIADGGCG